MTVRQLFLHVGSPKTGTTFLQGSVWASREQLAAQGLELPLRRGEHFRAALAVRELLDPEVDRPEWFDVLDRLHAALASSSAPRTLVTHEFLAAATEEQASGFVDSFPDYEVHIVLTARDLGRQVPAEWQQQIQHRRMMTYPHFLTSLRDGHPDVQHFWAAQDTADVARRWSARLPPERVHVVTVPPPGAPRGLLLERFSQVIGVDPARLNTGAAQGNDSMGLAQAELLRRVNVALGDRLPSSRAGYSRVAKDHLAQRLLATQPGERPGLPLEAYDWCEPVARRIIDAITTAGYSVVGDLHDLLPLRSTTEPMSLEVADSELVAAAVEALAGMLDQRHSDLTTIDELRQRVVRLRSRVQAAEVPSPGGRLRSTVARLRSRLS